MKKNNRSTGKEGEELAVKFLEKRGVQILFKNYFTKYGEIDLIGIQKKTIIFIEVKLRKNDSFGHPIESIDLKKRGNLVNAINLFLSKNDVNERDIRFDIITIFFYNNGYQIDWIKNQILEY